MSLSRARCSKSLLIKIYINNEQQKFKFRKLSGHKWEYNYFSRRSLVTEADFNNPSSKLFLLEIYGIYENKIATSITYDQH